MADLSMRDRIRAVIQGGEVDRVPFVQYENMVAPDREVWAEIGRENLGILRWVRAYRIEHPGCRSHTERIERQGIPGQRTVLETPWGTLTQESLIEPTYGSGSRKKHFVKVPEDYDVLYAYLENSVVVEDLSEVQAAYRDLGEDGLPLVRMERTPFQQLWIQWVNIEDLSYHLMDCPDRVQRCTDAMVRQARKTFEVVARTSLDFVDFPDNLTAPIIGEDHFRQHCVPLYDELAQMLADRDVPVFVHMDGDLKPLWDAIGDSGVRGLDSLSPPPDNDTSAGDAVSLWPEMRVFVNYPSSVHLKPPGEVYDKTGEILEQAGHTGRLQIQISENVPPGVWKVSFPEIVRAIRDFGRP